MCNNSTDKEEYNEYNLDNIIESLKILDKQYSELNLVENFVKSCCIDYIIANRNRNNLNWGILMENRNPLNFILTDSSHSFYYNINREEATLITKNVYESKDIIERVKSRILNKDNKRYDYDNLIEDLCNLGYRELMIEFIDTLIEDDFISLFQDDLLYEILEENIVAAVFLVTIYRLRKIKSIIKKEI